MTTHAAAKRTIADRWIAQWTDTPFSLDGEQMTPPKELPWARVSIRHDDSQQSSLGGIGARGFTRFGNVVVRLYTAFNRGSVQADDLVDRVREVLEGVTLPGPVWLQNAVAREGGIDGGAFVTTVQVDFFWEQQK